MTYIHVYADESRQQNSRYMLFGALFVPRGIAEQRLLEAADEVRQRHNLKAEMKWGKVSRAMLPAYKDFVDVLFTQTQTRFCCLVVDTTEIDYKVTHRGDYEAGFYSHYAFALSRHMDNAHRYQVFTDERNDRVAYRLANLKTEINAYWKRHGAETNVVTNVEPRVSHEFDQLQIVDVLLGSVGYEMEGYTSSAPKVELITHIIGRLASSNFNSYANDNEQFLIRRLPEEPNTEKSP